MEVEVALELQSEVSSLADVLRASELKFMTFADSLPTLAWMADGNGEITWYNRRWFEYTGTTPDRMEGWGWQAVHDPAMLPAVMARWQSSIASGEPFQMLYPLRGADGMFRIFLTRASPVKNDAGVVTQWVGTNTEVDELQQTKEALEKSEERLRLALSAVSTMGTFDWNITADQISFDPRLSRLYGVDTEPGGHGFPFNTLKKMMHPEDRGRVEAAVLHAIDTGEDFQAEYRVVHPGGEMRWVASRGSCLYNAKGDPLRFMGVGLDITTRKLTEQSLMQNEKLAVVGRMAASLAHEINNPLEAVSNLLFMAREAAGDPQVKEFLDTAEQELKRIFVTCNETLRFHRQQMQPTSAICDELIGSALTLYGAKLRSCGVVVEKRTRATQSVMCFEGEMRQVIGNLIGNALDAMGPTGGRLILRSRDGVDWATGLKGIVLTVADTGPGMSAQTVRRAFEPFFTTKDAAGTGLGLWISQEIVVQHKGRMRFQTSERAGKSGTVFTIFLPTAA